MATTARKTASKTAPKTARKAAARPAAVAASKTAPNAARKPKALALNIGLNFVDPRAYEGWDGELAACEHDARDIAGIARSRGMQPTLLLTAQATRARVLGALKKAAAALKAGDFFLLSFSGHGGQVPDTNRDEPDRKDETWCLWDGQLIDDELYFALSRFAAGVRILMLSDSCHSGTVAREGPPPPPPPGQRAKLMPAGIGRRVYEAHRGFYDQLQQEVAAHAAQARSTDPDAMLANVAVTGPAAAAISLTGPFKPAVILISGCQDNQTAMDGEHNGAFTEQLLRVWNDGAFEGNYTGFHARIRARLPGSQSPNLFTLGPAAAFLQQKPLAV